MVDFAATVLGGFQNDIVAVFGETAGWVLGHAILVFSVAIAIVAIRERTHILHYSGLGKPMAIDAAAILALTVLQFYIFTESFNFSTSASVPLALTSSLSIRWLVAVLG
ncbi:MAG: hypothetical protein VX492_03290 [Candidatus Thermoplasmatota archaeon]|nr:hypothetical protein [Candidatus Thermoplasmatota archaeon]